MAYGTLKCDNITFTNGGIDQTITVSGIVQSISGDITATGTIQGAAIIGTSTVSGATVTGTTANFVTVSGTTVTGTTANFGGVITAPTIRGTTTVSGATVTGTAGQFTTITGSSAGFTTVTGATVTGTTANFATLSGTTITGGHVTTASGTYTGNVTAAAFVPTGSSVPTNGVYLPSANNVAISTNGNGALFIDENGKFGIGTADPEAMLDITPEGASTAVLIRNSSLNFSAIGFRRYADISSYTAITANAEPSGYLGIIAGGFEKTRIDNSGSLLVGISSPRTNFFNGTVRTTLQVENASSGSGFISSVLNANNTLGPGIVLGKSRGATLGTNTVVVSGDAIGTLSFQGADGTNFVEAAAIAAAVDGTPGTNDMPGRLVFSTTADGASSPTERMRITSTGATLIGSTGVSDGERLKVESSGAGNSTAYFVYASSDDRPVVMSYHAGSTGATSRKHYEFRNSAGAEVGSIAATGTATSYNTSSDYRLKENIVALSGAIDRVNQLQVHRFNFIADPDTTVDGFIAHEAQAVVPECVTGTKDEVDDEGNPVYQGIDQSKLVPLLTAALQEALQKIEDLEGRLTAAGL
jgi:hypothetical protein